MTKKKRITILITGIFIAILAFFLVLKISTSGETLKTIGSAQMEEILNSSDRKEIIVYVGRPTCPECQKFEPILKEVLMNNSMKIYYYNTDEARKTDENSLEYFASALGIEVVPTIVKISNGEVVSKLEGFKNQKAISEFIR